MLPIVMGFGLSMPNYIVWWALSLGVLAGSSASLTGATAWPVAASLVENTGQRQGLKLPGGNAITLEQFARIGLPVTFIFLIVSSIYILWLCRTYG
ncbi:MAG: hypothetical protein HQK55_11080 [Deltaproteobacteria bacterium]|nr:hypothetical protein [Deltaproteobacteria bacterium]